MTARALHDRAQDRPFRSFGEQLLAIQQKGLGLGEDPRLRGIHEAYAAATGGSETIPSDGGFLIQTDFQQTIITDAFNQGEILKRCWHVPISSKSNGLKLVKPDETSRVNGSRFGGVQAFWANEADTATAKKPTWARVNMELEKLTGLCYLTEELSDDVVAQGSVLQRAFTSELTTVTEDAIVNGSGAGQPLGILGSTALITQGSSAGGANTIKIADIVGMFSRLLPGSIPTAVWLISPSAYPQLFVTAAGSVASGPYFNSATSERAPYGTLLGLPVIPVDYCQQLGTLGDIILADLASYVVIDKPPATVLSIHVRFVNSENVFRFTYRVDGEPYYQQPIQPLRGTLTLSPFIAFTSTRT